MLFFLELADHEDKKSITCYRICSVKATLLWIIIVLQAYIYISDVL